jgi:hypothetical protein
MIGTFGNSYAGVTGLAVGIPSSHVGGMSVPSRSWHY